MTPLWTVAFTDPGSSDVAIAVVGAAGREDAVRRALDVLGDDVTVVWVAPQHMTAVGAVAA